MAQGRARFSIQAKIADQGLNRLATLDERGRDERQYLDVLREQLEHGQTPADITAQAWRDRWAEDMTQLVSSLELTED